MSDKSRRDLLRYYALTYAAAGLRVAPAHYVLSDRSCSCGNPECGSVGKHPLTKHGVDDATWDIRQVERWWNATPSANIILVPDVIRDTTIEWMVLDLDVGKRVRGGKTVVLDGYADLQNLEHKFGEEVPRQIVQRSGSGGEHLIMLKDPGRMPAKLGPAIDVISGSGKYIIAAPSNHVSGYLYEWKNDRSGMGPFIDRIDRVLPKIDFAPTWVMEFDPHSDKVSTKRRDSDDGADLKAIRRSQGTDLSKEEFADAVALIPNDDAHYDDYLAMLFAIHHEAAAKEDMDWGRDLAQAWAEKSNKFVVDDFDHRWSSIRDADARYSKTGKYVLMLAGQQGWKVPERGPIGDAVRELNLKHAMVLNGGQAMIVTFDKDEKKRERISFSSARDLAPWYANKLVPVPDPTDKEPDRVKMTPKDKVWTTSANRREYHAMVFDPRGAIPGVLNLWQGFAYKPAKLKNPYNGCSKWVDHIYDVIAQGNKDDAKWIVGWFAHMVQKPWEKLGTSLVLIGKQGVGKTVIGDHFGALMPHHHSVVDKSEQIVGKFNMQLARCVFLQAEEAFWAGDKAAEGSLRHLISGQDLTIEPKGIDAYKIANYTRLMVTTNHSWAVPAGENERRFAVWRVPNDRLQDIPYFRAMGFQMHHGGYEALLQYLLEFDLSSVNIRKIPHTAALLDQKIASADPHVRWLFERLTDGTGWEREDRESEIDTENFYTAYLAFCREHRAARPLDIRMFGREVSRFGFQKVKKQTARNRRYVYSTRDLRATRRDFETIFGQKIDWDG